MGKKTINQALKDLFLGLGGDSSALADNSSVSDYIEDLESAIKGAASGELPEVTAEDIGDVLAVVSDGESGAQWGKGEIPSELPSVEATDIGDVLTVVSDGESGAEWAKAAPIIPAQNVAVFEVNTSTNKLVNCTLGDIKAAITAKKAIFLFDAIYTKVFTYVGFGTTGNKYQFTRMATTSTTPITTIGFEMVAIAQNEPDTATTVQLVSASLTVTT